jgi:rhamnulokinase
MSTYLASDLGAESGRVIAGSLEKGRISITEMHRFPTGGTPLVVSLRWNIIGILEQIRTGLAKAAKSGFQDARGVSVDSWGVDYVWFREGQPLLAQPYHYRDQRTDSTYAELLETLGRERIFNATGIQFMPLNSIYQFRSDTKLLPEILAHPDSRWLNIADYLLYQLSGVARAEESIASTTQIYDPTKRFWSLDLVDAIGLPRSTLPSIVPSGTVLGSLTDEKKEITGLTNAQVIASCSHDTAAAVAAVPAEGGDDWAYLSSGTWSLLGVELPKPIINRDVLAANYTNEVGYGGSIRFLHNIVGLWILQETRRDLERKGTQLDYAALNEAAAAVPPLRSIIHPNDARFLRPGDMVSKVQAFCRETDQPVPQTPGELTRCILDSLALLYGVVIDQIEGLTGRRIRKLHIVGGGSRSELLNQATADASGRLVIAGPGEATALGNIAVQALALGDIGNLEEARAIIRASSELKTYQPTADAAWSKARERFTKLPRTL